MRHLFRFAAGNIRKSAFTTILNLVGLTSAFATFILMQQEPR